MGISEVTVTKTGGGVVTAHPYLYHYTKREALSGILASQTLWATYYRDLDDDQEIVTIKKQLRRAIFETIYPIVAELYERGDFYRNIIRQNGGLWTFSLHDTIEWVNALFTATLEPSAKGVPSFEAYVTSFSTHNADSALARRHGLASQWDSYGRNGYALVFDTEPLDGLLARAAARHNAYIVFGDVVYDGDAVKFEEEFGSFIDVLKASTARIFAGGSSRYLEPALTPFFTTVARFKRADFCRQREVRIAVYRETDHAFYQHTPRAMADGRFPVHTGIRKYVELFGHRRTELPIARIIVGPGEDQMDRRAEAEALVRRYCRKAIPIERCEILVTD